MGKWADRWINGKVKSVNKIAGLQTEVDILRSLTTMGRMEDISEKTSIRLQICKVDSKLNLLLNHLNLEYVLETIEPAKLIKKSKAKK